jgi:hypothetical protein
MEVCEMTMRQLIESLNSTPSLRARFEAYNKALEEDSGGANRRSDQLGKSSGKVSEGKVQAVPDRVGGVS